MVQSGSVPASTELCCWANIFTDLCCALIPNHKPETVLCFNLIVGSESERVHKNMKKEHTHTPFNMKKKAKCEKCSKIHFPEIASFVSMTYNNMSPD